MNTRRIIWFCYAEKMWRNQLLLRCSFLSGKIINCLDTWSGTPFFFFFLPRENIGVTQSPQSFSFGHYLEKEMATQSGTLAWKIPWTEKPGRLQLMGSQRVGYDWADMTESDMTERIWLHFHGNTLKRYINIVQKWM